MGEGNGHKRMASSSEWEEEGEKKEEEEASVTLIIIQTALRWRSILKNALMH